MIDGQQFGPDGIPDEVSPEAQARARREQAIERGELVDDEEGRPQDDPGAPIDRIDTFERGHINENDYEREWRA